MDVFSHNFDIVVIITGSGLYYSGLSNALASRMAAGRAAEWDQCYLSDQVERKKQKMVAFWAILSQTLNSYFKMGKHLFKKISG